MRDAVQKVPRAGDSGLWYNLSIGAIGLSAMLYLVGRKHLGLFVGLWPPTFAALGNRAELNEKLHQLSTGRPVERVGNGRTRRHFEPTEGAEGEVRRASAA